MSKLLFNGSVGKLYDDKLVIKKNKIAIESIQRVDLLFFIDKRMNIVFFTIGSLGIIGSSFLLNVLLVTLFFFLFFFFWILLSMMYKEKRYYFRIINTNSDEIIIKIRKKEKDAAKQLLKQYMNYMIRK